MATTPEKIRDARARLGMTQRELAEALDVSTTTVYRWEAGRQGREILRVVELALCALERAKKTEK
jgi:DNA-binding XRE family transcriptional regulator